MQSYYTARACYVMRSEASGFASAVALALFIGAVLILCAVAVV